MAICKPFLLSSLFPAVLLSMQYMENSFYFGGLGGGGACPPGAVPCLFHCAVQDYSLTSLQRGLTGQKVNIGVHGIMSIPYLFTCRPVNLSSRVDRSRGKYNSAGHYGYLSTWGRTGLMVRASDSGSGDPGSILGRVGVFVSLSKRHLLPKSTGNTQE